jgi:hypothetical protein
MEYLGPVKDGLPSPVRAILDRGTYKIALRFKRLAEFDPKVNNFRLGYRPVNYNKIPSTWFIGYDRLKSVWSEDKQYYDLVLIAFTAFSISGGIELGFSYTDYDLPAPMPLIPSWDDSRMGDLVTQKFIIPVTFD